MYIPTLEMKDRERERESANSKRDTDTPDIVKDREVLQLTKQNAILGETGE